MRTNNKRNSNRYTRGGNSKTNSRCKSENGKGMNKEGKGRNWASEDPSKSTNDPSWYATNTALLRDAASIPFSWATGTSVDLNNPLYQELPATEGEFTVPGIMTFWTSMSVGRSSDPTSPVNVAATSLYGWVRHANSGSAMYDAPDLMLYIMAMTQVYAFLNWAQRVYGTSSLYAQGNRYLADALLTAQMLDAEDIHMNQANLRYGINTLINKVGSLAVPADMPIVQREAFMHANVYIEGTSIKDQMYLANPFGWYFFEYDEDGAGMLKYHPYSEFASSDGKLTTADIIAIGHRMIAPILASEDMNIMSGDILKAYGGNILKLTTLPEQYPIIPIYDPMVLTQLKNATTGSNGVLNLDIKQSADKGYLIHEPKLLFAAVNYYPDTVWQGNAFTKIAETYLEDRLLTVATDEATPEVVMEATRLMFAASNFNRTDVKPDQNTSVCTMDIYPGSDIVHACTIYYYEPNAETRTLTLKSQNWDTLQPMLDDSDPDKMAAAWQLTARASCFKYHPYASVTIAREGSTAGTFNIASGFHIFDVDNYAVLTTQMLYKLHETALLSLWNVPVITRV